MKSERIKTSIDEQALLLSKLLKNKVRWATHRSKWMKWNGTYWEEGYNITYDATTALRSYYKQLLEASTDETEIKWLEKKISDTNSYSKIEKITNLLKEFDGIKTEPYEWDSNPWLLNVLNGTFDLRTLTLREYDSKDLITRVAPVEYDPSAKCKAWKRHIEFVVPNPNIRRQLQRDLGKALVGLPSENYLYIWLGDGFNGKTTTFRVFRDILGNYVCMAPPTLFVRTKYRHPTDVACVHVRRLVDYVEIDKFSKFGEDLVRRVVTGSKLRGKYIAQKFFEFEPTFSIVLKCRKTPIIKIRDEDVWDHIRVIPWEVVIPPEKERPMYEVVEELLEEKSGILNWLIEGFIDWQNDPNWVADEVRAATLAYKIEMYERTGSAIDPRLLYEYVVSRDELYKAYVSWCIEKGKKVLSKKDFSDSLRARGIREVRYKNTVYFVGLKLKENFQL